MQDNRKGRVTGMCEIDERAEVESDEKWVALATSECQGAMMPSRLTRQGDKIKRQDQQNPNKTFPFIKLILLPACLACLPCLPACLLLTTR